MARAPAGKPCRAARSQREGRAATLGEGDGVCTEPLTEGTRDDRPRTDIQTF